MKATHSNMLRGVASSTSRRAFHLTSTARSASKTSTFGLTSRRPLAVVDRAFNGARLYASSAEGNAPGVVSNKPASRLQKQSNDRYARDHEDYL